MANNILKLSGGLQVGSLTTSEIASLGLENGTIVYNSDTNKLVQVANGSTEEVSSVDSALVQIELDSIKNLTPWKYNVRCASYENINISSTIFASQFQPLVLSDGDRVLLKDQTLKEENGIYKFTLSGISGTLTRDADASTWDAIIGCQVYVEESTTNGILSTQGKQVFTCISSPIGVIEIDDIIFRKIYVDSYGSTMYGDLDMGGVDPANPLELKHKIVNFSELSSESDPLLQELNFFKTNSETLKFKTSTTSENIPVSFTQQEYTTIPSPVLIKENTITMEKSPDLAIKLTSNDVAGDKVSTVELNPSAPYGFQAEDGIKLKFDDGILERKIHLSSDGLNISLNLATDTFTVGGSKISMLGTPDADDDAATKLYVDTVAGGGPTEVTIANNQTIPANVTGFVVDKTLNKAFTADVSVIREVTQTGIAEIQSNGVDKKVNGFYTVGTDTFVFGDFDKGIYKINASGVKDNTFETNIGTGFNGEITAITYGGFVPEAYYAVFGKFTEFNGQTRNRVCFITASGQDVPSAYSNFGTTMSNGTGFDGDVLCAVSNSFSMIVIGGSFNNLNSTTVFGGLCAVDIGPMAGTIYNFQGITELNSKTQVAVEENNFNLYYVDSGNLNKIYKISNYNQPFTFFIEELTQGTGFNGNIYSLKFSNAVLNPSLIQEPGSVLYVGGAFTSHNGNAVTKVARFDLTQIPSYYSSNAPSFPTPITLTGNYVKNISVDPVNGALFFCTGDFTFNSGLGNITNCAGFNDAGLELTALSTYLGTGFTYPMSASIINIPDLTTNTFFGEDFYLGNTNKLYGYSSGYTYAKTLTMQGAYNRQTDNVEIVEYLVFNPTGTDETGVTLTMDSTGQLQYTSNNLPTNTSYLRYKLTLL